MQIPHDLVTVFREPTLTATGTEYCAGKGEEALQKAGSISRETCLSLYKGKPESRGIGCTNIGSKCSVHLLIFVIQKSLRPEVKAFFNPKDSLYESTGYRLRPGIA